VRVDALERLDLVEVLGRAQGVAQAALPAVQLELHREALEQLPLRGKTIAELVVRVLGEQEHQGAHDVEARVPRAEHAGDPRGVQLVERAQHDVAVAARERPQGPQGFARRRGTLGFPAVRGIRC